MILKLLIALLIAVGLVAVAISLQPAEYKVVRTATLNAPPSAVYNQISDFHNWNAWSPWAKLDPNMAQSFEGAASGVGAKYRWVGNSEAGAGSMEIDEVAPGQRVSIKLEFLKPFPSSSRIIFTLQPEGSGTKVEWAMVGASTFASKAISLFSSMDKMVGPDFEKGLAQLRSATEAAAH